MRNPSRTPITLALHRSMQLAGRGGKGPRSVAIINHTMRDVGGRNVATDPKNPRKAAVTLALFLTAHSDCSAAGARDQLRAITDRYFVETGTEEHVTTREERAEFFRLKRDIIAAEDAAIREARLSPLSSDDDSVIMRKLHTGTGTVADIRARGMLMFSIWRPLEVVAKRDPLTILEQMSADLKLETGEGYVPLPRVYRNRPCYVAAHRNINVLIKAPREGGPEHRWLYLSEKRPNEVLTLKSYDSDALGDGLKGVEEDIKLICPYSAFHLDGTEDELERRKL